jgi:hypothetical protein
MIQTGQKVRSLNVPFSVDNARELTEGSIEDLTQQKANAFARGIMASLNRNLESPDEMKAKLLALRKKIDDLIAELDAPAQGTPIAQDTVPAKDWTKREAEECSASHTRALETDPKTGGYVIPEY